ncbi:MAG: hypothetical protein ACLTQI_07940 [Slackia sp.]
MSGNETTTAASTVAGQLKMSGQPMSMNQRPSAVLLPRRSNSTKPHTVGGKTMGIVKTESAISCALEGMRRLHHAARRPSTNTRTIAVPVVFSVTHKGLQSSFARNWLASSMAEDSSTNVPSSHAAKSRKSA